ncbi:Trans-aconitate 2-methyltransferase [compost metagenome]|uniref:class I SAM-dependent methyltransferase n=1 Tax=Cupriavidus necator TaxID=106590 RepID=UPI0028B34949
MTQNIYDNPDFFAGYSQLQRSRQGLDGAPEWPALRAQLPAMEGLRVVDLGCGYGWFCRWAAAEGAAEVLGLDVSERMLERARSMELPATVGYRLADLETLALPPASFDVAYSSLAFHYIWDLPRLFAGLRAALVPGGWLVFSIEHPVFMASRQAGWQVGADGRPVWPVDSYQSEGRRDTDWLGSRLVKYHRTLGTTLNALIRAGFSVAHVEEWGPTDAQVAAQPALAMERERPMLAIVAARAAPASP